MDDTQQNGVNPQPTTDGMQTVSAPMASPMDPTAQPTMASMGDLAGMTPPPAPVQDMSMQPAPMPEPAPVPPVMDNTLSQSIPTSPLSDMNTSMQMPVQSQTPDMSTFTSAASPMPAPTPTGNTEADDYAYAEDLLDEILDSLDRIEAKLEAIEKKMGQ